LPPTTRSCLLRATCTCTRGKPSALTQPSPDQRGKSRTRGDRGDGEELERVDTPPRSRSKSPDPLRERRSSANLDCTLRRQRLHAESGSPFRARATQLEDSISTGTITMRTSTSPKRSFKALSFELFQALRQDIFNFNVRNAFKCPDHGHDGN